MAFLYCNKKGASIIVLLMIGILFMLLGLALTPALTDVKNEAISTPQLNCSNTSISDQDKAICTSVDIQPFIFMGTIFGLASIILAGAFLR